MNSTEPTIKLIGLFEPKASNVLVKPQVLKPPKKPSKKEWYVIFIEWEESSDVIRKYAISASAAYIQIITDISNEEGVSQDTVKGNVCCATAAACGEREPSIIHI